MTRSAARWPQKKCTRAAALVHSPFQKLMILDNHNLSQDTNADRCTTLRWCSRTDQRRRGRCWAPKRSSCHDTGCCSQPLPCEQRCVGRSKYIFLVTSTSFLLLSIFRLYGCYFSGWGSPVDGYWFQKHQPSRWTTVTTRGRDVRRNPDAVLQIDKGGAHPKTHVCFDKNKTKKAREFSFIPAHFGLFCCRPLCIAPVQLHCKANGDWPLRAAGGIDTCTTHTCSKRVWVKRQIHWFRAKKGKLLSQGRTHLKLEC